MKVISLASLIESSVHDTRSSGTISFENAAGQIQDFDKLLNPQSLAALSQQHNGPFALLAYHPIGDAIIADYLAQGTLASDSGIRVLVLFVVNRKATWPTTISRTMLSGTVRIETGTEQSADLVQRLFKDGGCPLLPGLMFFERFAITEPVFVELHGLKTPDEVRASIRKFCSWADHAYSTGKTSGATFASEFGLALARENVSYHRTEPKCLYEWIHSGFHTLMKYKQDLVTMIGLMK
jgi:hypothetical protein